MRKLFLSALLLLSCTAAFAQTYNYLTFVTAQGEQSLKAEGMVITFSDGNLIAAGTEGTVTFPLTSLSTFYFAETATGISPTAAEKQQKADVYTVAGAFVGTYDGNVRLDEVLKKGIYLVKYKDETRKLIVR